MASTGTEFPGLLGQRFRIAADRIPGWQWDERFMYSEFRQFVVAKEDFRMAWTQTQPTGSQEQERTRCGPSIREALDEPLVEQVGGMVDPDRVVVDTVVIRNDKIDPASPVAGWIKSATETVNNFWTIRLFWE